MILLNIGCATDVQEGEADQSKLFRKLPAKRTGLDFENTVVQTEQMNYFEYQYVLNGGGVAAEDLNNDGLPDLYFTSNQNSNKLYVNKGGLRFDDATEESGTSEIHSGPQV